VRFGGRAVLEFTCLDVVTVMRPDLWLEEFENGLAFLWGS
jgi:hypothetical protein